MKTGKHPTIVPLLSVSLFLITSGCNFPGTTELESVETTPALREAGEPGHPPSYRFTLPETEPAASA